jgi:hypothetical protein
VAPSSASQNQPLKLEIKCIPEISLLSVARHLRSMPPNYVTRRGRDAPPHSPAGWRRGAGHSPKHLVVDRRNGVSKALHCKSPYGRTIFSIAAIRIKPALTKRGARQEEQLPCRQSLATEGRRWPAHSQARLLRGAIWPFARRSSSQADTDRKAIEHYLHKSRCTASPGSSLG